MKSILKIYWPYFLLVPFVAAAVVGWICLPGEVTVAFGAGGTLPKLVGLLVPVALAALGSSQVCFAGRRQLAGILILLIAAIVVIQLFAWNL